MKHLMKHARLILLWGLILLLTLSGCGIGEFIQTDLPASNDSGTLTVALPLEVGTEEAGTTSTERAPPETEAALDRDGSYTTRDEVALYLHTYGTLPGNFITKAEAQALGWVSSKGNLWEVAPGKSIGGDYFGNYEGLLPKERGRSYAECDIDFDGGYRGAKRIIYSNDGLIYYTEDHYASFTQLY